MLDTHTATVNWGDGTSSAGQVSEAAGSGTVTATHDYADNGPYTVRAKVRDKDGGVTEYTATIDVANAPPTPTITGAPTESDEGTPIALGSTVTDPGSADTFTYAWAVTKDGAPYAAGTWPMRTCAASLTRGRDCLAGAVTALVMPGVADGLAPFPPILRCPPALA